MKFVDFKFGLGGKLFEYWWAFALRSFIQNFTCYFYVLIFIKERSRVWDKCFDYDSSISLQAGKGDSVRARAILRSLISLDDLGQILSLRFTIPNLATTGPLDGEYTIYEWFRTTLNGFPLGDTLTNLSLLLTFSITYVEVLRILFIISSESCIYVFWFVLLCTSVNSQMHITALSCLCVHIVFLFV